MKRYLLFFALMPLMTLADVPEIRNVMVKQRYPWNGKVDISYEVVGNLVSGYTNIALSVLAKNQAGGTNYIADINALCGDVNAKEGMHHIIWDLNAQGLAFKSEDVVFEIAYEGSLRPRSYCVVNLASGANATAYPVSYMDAPPSGGFNVDQYKTTKLVLRLIEPGSFKMCGQYDVVLTKPYYIVDHAKPNFSKPQRDDSGCLS